MPGGDDERLLHDGTSAAREERAAERAPGGRFLAWSVALHVALAVALLAVGLVPLLCRRDEPTVPQEEFVVALPPDEPEEEPEQEPDPPEDEPDEPPPPPDEPDPGPDVVPVTTTTTRTPPTTTTTTTTRPPRPTTTTTTRDRRAEATRVTRRPAPTTTRRPRPTTTTRRAAVQPPPGPRLSAEEVSRLLNAGAEISDHTSIPSSEMSRCFAIINRAIRKAWIRPDAASITGNDPEISISIGSGGVVRSVSLSKSSGNAVFDQSVLSAARAVRKFEGLSEEFIRAKPTFTVAFNLREAN